MTPSAAVSVLATAVGLSAMPVMAQAQDAVNGLHVVSIGSNDPVLIVLHGGPGMRHNYLRPEWDSLEDVASIIYYDQRACGLSTREGPFTWQQHVRDLDVLVNEISSNGTVFLAGSSWGAMLAVLYAHAHPERLSGLVISGIPSWTQLVDSRRARYAAQHRSRQIGLEHTVGVVTFPAARLAEMEIDSTVVANPADAPPDADLTIHRRLGRFCRLPSWITLESLFDAPPLSDLGSLQIPVLVLDGDDPDPRGSGAEDLVGVLPNAELYVVHGAGHDPWLDKSETFFPIVRRFLLERF